MGAGRQVYRIDEDPSEKFELDPVLYWSLLYPVRSPVLKVTPRQVRDKAERDPQLAIAKAAVEKHVGSLRPVVNQIALGSDRTIRQEGGSALCGWCGLVIFCVLHDSGTVVASWCQAAQLDLIPRSCVGAARRSLRWPRRVGG